MATDLERLIREIQTLSPEEQRRVRDALDQRVVVEPLHEERAAEEEFQRRLVAAGLLKEVKRPLRDAQAFRNRRLIEVKGRPLSETIIEDRR